MGTITLGNTAITHVDGSLQYKNVEEREFYIYNSNYWTPLNGGQCCLWTVPAGTTSIKFEILSGGGPGGSSGGDYDYGVGGQGGHYTAKTIRRAAGDFVPGCQYTICAAGTSDCSCCCVCNCTTRHGCTSYVTGSGLSNFCAIGGQGGYTGWDIMDSCYNCHIGNGQCNLGIYNGQWANCTCNTPTYGGDIEFRGSMGSMFKQYNCCADWGTVAGSPSGPFSASAGIGGKHWCTGDLACCSSNSAFPGGGGAGHGTGSSNACWGSFGAGGLVKVSYS